MATNFLKRNPYWLRSGLYSLGYRISVLIFGFGGFYFLIRHLPQAEFGAWALFLTITTVIEMSRNGLIQNALIKFLSAAEPIESNKIITASWLINITYTAVIYLLLIAVSESLSRNFDVTHLNRMFIYYGATIFLLIPLSQFNYIQQQKLSFSGIFWSAIVKQGSFFFAIVYIYYSGQNITLIGLVQVQTGCTLLGLFCSYLAARTFLNNKLEWDWAIIRKVFQFGKYVMGTNLCSLLNKSIDQLSIGYFLNVNSVAIYNSAIRMSNLIEYPSTAIAEVVYPQSALRTTLQGDKAAKILYEKSVGLTLAITIPIVVVSIIFADYIIYFIAGSQYMEAVPILRITMLFGIFTSFTRQFGTVMDSSGRPRLNFQVLLMSLILNIICNFIFIKYFGLMGAAYGTLVSTFTFFVVTQVLLINIFRIELLQIFYSTLSFYRAGLDFSVKNLKLKWGAS